MGKLTQKTLNKIMVALVLLAAVWPSPGMALNAPSLTSPVFANNAAAGLVRRNFVVSLLPAAAAKAGVVVSIAASQASDLVSVAAIQAVFSCQSANLTPGLILGPGAVNLNQPANCFSFSNRQSQFSYSNINLRVKPLAASAVKVLVLGTATLLTVRFSSLPVQNLPALAATVLGVIAVWAFDRKKLAVKNKINSLAAAPAYLPLARMEVLLC